MQTKNFLLAAFVTVLLLFYCSTVESTFSWDSREGAGPFDSKESNEFDRRLATVKFASGLGKRLVSAKFASGLGKRLVSAKFASGLGKRLATAKFASGLGKRSEFDFQ